MKRYCAECRKAISKRNPSSSGGMIMDYSGKCTRWVVCAKCRPPLTAADFSEFMTEAFKLEPWPYPGPARPSTNPPEQGER